MENKKYASYAQIEQDLAVLKVEKEIYYQKIILNIEKTKDSFFPSNTASFLKSVYEKVFSGNVGTVLKIAIPYFFNWYINKKRGH